MSRPRTGSPTVRDVAARAGVAPATAARALGGYGAVSEPVRERVQQAAADLGYRANSLARSMITGTTNTLALVVADIENPFFARSQRGFTDYARKEGYEVIVANTDEDVDVERVAVKVLLEKRVDGLAVAPATRDVVEHLESALRAGARVVLLDRHVPRLPVDSVLVDSKAAADRLVTHLVEAGHERIAMVTGASPEELGRVSALSRHLMSTGRDRIDGYRQALRRAGLAVRPDYIRLGDFHRDAAGLMAEELLGLPEPPTAIFATDAVITLGVMQRLQALRVRVPRDVSLVGFDDPDWASVVSPALTVVSQPAYELGQLAAERLIARIRGDESKPRRHLLATTLCVRESVAAPRGAKGSPESVKGRREA